MKLPDKLLRACRNGKPALVQKFLDEGADPNGPADCKPIERPLIEALCSRQYECAELLVQNGARPGLIVENAYLLFDRRPQRKWVLPILNDAAPGKLLDEAVQRCVYYCAELNPKREEMIELYEALLAFGTENPFGFRRSVLKNALLERNTVFARRLIHDGFPLSTADGETPLLVQAVALGDVELFDLLKERGADFRLRCDGHLRRFALANIDGFEPNPEFQIFAEGNLLHFACVAGSTACAKRLLELGVDPVDPDSEGRSPADLALIAGERSAEILKLLPVGSLRPRSPAELFSESVLGGDAKAIEELLSDRSHLSLQIGSEQSSAANAMTIAACTGNIEMLRLLVDRGADLESVDREDDLYPKTMYTSFGREMGFYRVSDFRFVCQRGPLGWAAANGHLDAVNFLLDRGANMEATDGFMMTPFHNAVCNDHREVVDRLIALGCNVKARAFDRQSALHIAVSSEASSVITPLIQAGVKPTWKDRDSETAVDLAREHELTDILRRIEQHVPAKRSAPAKRQATKQTISIGSAQEREAIVSAVIMEYGRVDGRKSRTAKSRAKQLDLLTKQCADRIAMPVFQTLIRKIARKVHSTETHFDSESCWRAELVGCQCSWDQLSKMQLNLASEGAFLFGGFPFHESSSLYLVPVAESLDAVALCGTHGSNFDLGNEGLVSWLWSLRNRFPFAIQSIGWDGLEICFEKAVNDAEALICEIQTMCPPPAEDLAEAQEALRRQLKKPQATTMLWWD